MSTIYPSVHVAIPHYNAYETLPSLLASLGEDDFSSITVLDDHSNDQDRLRSIQATFPYVDIIFGDRNRGAGGNRNRILELGKTGLVWFLDCDMELVTEHNATAIRQLFEQNKHRMVGGTILNRGGTPMEWNYGHEMHPLRDQRFKQLVNTNNLAELDANSWDYPWIKGEKVQRSREVDWVAEGSFVVSLADFAKAGGYDEAFRYHEGQDLAHRLRELGVDVCVVSTIVTRHLEIDVRKDRRQQEVEDSAELFYEKFNISILARNDCMNNPESKVVEKGTYRHTKKGHLYEVLGVALHTETGEQLVTYRPLYENQYELFARPYDMFVEQVEINGEMQPRFEKIDD